MKSEIKKVISREVVIYISALILMFFIDLTNVFVVNSFNKLLLAAFVIYVPITIIAWAIRRKRLNNGGARMKKVILIFFCLMLLPLTANASQVKDADASSIQQEVVEAPDAIEPPDWGDNNEFESSFDGGEPSFGEDGDESD
jgi:hypothetical protein